MKQTNLYDDSFFSVIFREKNGLTHSKAINKLRFMNDSTFYSGARDSIIKLWSISDNENDTNSLNLISNYGNHYNWITDLSLSLRKQFLFSASNDQSICQWDVSTHSLIKKFHHVHKDYITAIQYNDMKDYLYSSGLDGLLYEINIDRGNATSWICNTKEQSIYSFDSSKDGNEFLVAYYDNNLVLFDGRVKRNQVLKQLKGHDDMIRKVQLSSDSTKAVSISNDSTVRIWDIPQGKELHRFDFHSSPVMSLYVNEDFTRIITGSKQGAIYLIDLTISVYTKIDKLPEGILSIAMNSSESKLLISSGNSLYHYQLKKEKSKEKKNISNELGSIAFNTDDNIRQSTVIVKDEIIECSILKNKIYVIVRYEDNSIALFNLFKLKQIYRSTQFSFKELKDKLNKICTEGNKLKSWCVVDIKLGSLAMEITEKTALVNKAPIDMEIDLLEKYIKNNFNDAKLEHDLVVIDKKQIEKEIKTKDKGQGKENKNQKQQTMTVLNSNDKDKSSCCSIIFDHLVINYLYWYLYNIISHCCIIDHIDKYIIEYLTKFIPNNNNGFDMKEITMNPFKYQIAFFDTDSITNNSIQLLFFNKNKDFIFFPKFIYNEETIALFKDLYFTKATDRVETKLYLTIDKTSIKDLDQKNDRSRIDDLMLTATFTLDKLYSFLIKNLDQSSLRQYITNEIQESNLNENQKKYIENISLVDNSIFIELTYGDILLRPSNTTLKLIKTLFCKEQKMTIHLKYVSIEELIKRGTISFDN